MAISPVPLSPNISDQYQEVQRNKRRKNSSGAKKERRHKEDEDEDKEEEEPLSSLHLDVEA